MGQSKKIFGNILVLAVLCCCVAAVTVLRAQQDKSPEEKPSVDVTQPIPFSHKQHVGLELPCNFCHENKDPDADMTLPSVARCMGCHAKVATEKPAIKKVAGYAQRNEAIPWVRVYSVPGFVYWSHRTHLDAKMKCEMCHGDVSEMEVVRKVTGVTTMGGCVQCHRQHEANTGCQTCHESQSP
jgi:hypothetical protein